MSRNSCKRICIIAAAMLSGLAAQAQERHLAELDLATLMSMDVTITSAAKHAQASADAAAAVYVITRDDIRRSGATSIPQLLRLAPGLQVARITTRSWSVTARGFGTRFANKLLVMVDGRSIYNALFSGVTWEEQPIVLDNIERIEVVRGPGGALWGINAVNGVINIITRSASDSPGLHVQAGSGTRETEASMRYAGESNWLGEFRTYLMSAEVESYDRHATPLERMQAGWRIDRNSLGGDLTLEGEWIDSDFSAYDGMRDSSYPRYATTGNVLANWRRDTSVGAVNLRSFYSWVDRADPGGWNEDTTGLDAEVSARRLGRHLFSGGASWRRITDEQLGFIPSLALMQRRNAHEQWSVSGQDELHFFADAVRVIVGAKLENFEYTGLALQPTLRSIWKVNDVHTMWAAASRALRTPSRFELHSNVRALIAEQPPIYFVMLGDENLRAEQLEAFEWGWRWRAAETVSIDLALYYNRYTDLIGVLELPPRIDPGPPFTIDAQRLLHANMLDADTRGAELAAEWRVTPRLRLQMSGALFDVDTTGAYSGANLTTALGRIDPARSVSMRARLDLPRDVTTDLSWRYVGALRGLNVDAYDALDVRVAWQLGRTLEIACSIENALGGRHVEFQDELARENGVTLERTAFGRLTWRPSR